MVSVVFPMNIVYISIGPMWGCYKCEREREWVKRHPLE